MDNPTLKLHVLDMLTLVLPTLLVIDRFSNPGASSNVMGIICPPGWNRVNRPLQATPLT